MSIELAEDDQSYGDNVPPVNGRAVPRVNSHFVVLREGKTSPEIFFAEDREDASRILSRQVQTGEAKWVALYELVGSYAFVPSSEFVPPAEMDITSNKTVGNPSTLSAAISVVMPIPTSAISVSIPVSSYSNVFKGSQQ